MQIMGTGLRFDGTPLFKPVDEETMVEALRKSLAANAPRLRSLTRSTTEAFSFRSVMTRVTVDPGDPRQAGWSFLVRNTDPQRDAICEILKPLATHRGMVDPANPLVLDTASPDEWFDWLNDNYHGLDLEGKKVPAYVLIAGGPDQVPFGFQALLDVVANVGRVDFESLDDLKAYVDKVVRIETAGDPYVEKEVLLFATDGGLGDPTYFSRRYMAEPLSEHVRDDLGFATHTIFGDDATKENLVAGLTNKKPAVVYTASHGLGAVSDPPDIQRRYNGAICCQHTGPLTLDSLFSGDDVPTDRPFLEGAVVFQFACFGYGTPKVSDYSHWIDGVPETYTDADFVAALPRKLLAHPQGPVAYIGHLDTAWLHAFADPEQPHTIDRWHSRINPFKQALDRLLGVQPPGFAMERMNSHYSVCNALITNTYDRDKRGTLNWTPEVAARFLDSWIVRSDAQNYMVLGDPGVGLLIAA
jgi:hypothetical protein